MRSKLALVLVLAATSVAAPRVASAQEAPEAAKADRTVAVTVGSSSYVRMGKQVSRVAVGDAHVASVTAFDPDQLLISGLRPGRTTATVWVGGEAKVVAIDVGWPVTEMRDALRRALPTGKNLEVAHAGRAVILSGEVANAEDLERAEKIVGGIAAGVYEGGDPTLVNALRLAGAQQVQLEVSFAEVSRSSLREIGFNFFSKKSYSSGKGFSAGMLSPGTDLNNVSPDPSNGAIGNLNHDAAGAPLISGPIGGAFGFVFSSTLGGFPFSAALSLLSSKGYARTLAEPTLVAMSGKSASFLAGGEFPVPLPQALGQLGVEYRKFGIQLVMTPTVSGKDITLDLGVTVSDIDQSIGVRIASTQVPGLRERHSQTTVRLVDGQSFVIAGLISDEVRSTVDKVPLLGSIPVLGALFRSSAYRRQETELLVVVTAHTVQPLDAKPPLPGEKTLVDPGDLELFFLGRAESQRGGSPAGAVGFKR
ncbi:MAG: type II and III secretion system protein family protein [Myxococcales bacterium]|nr:type II and III secretion system protein family protein [Myxococcales bacterium]